MRFWDSSAVVPLLVEQDASAAVGRALQVDALSAELAKGAPRPPFTLIFSGPPGDVLREGLYTLEVEGGPSFDLYVIPVHTPVLGRQDYQVAIN